MHEDKFKTGVSSKAYKENFKKIFGEGQKETGRFMMVDGELKPISECTKEKCVTVISDMEEGVSPITGEVISGRRAMREHCQQHNVYYTGR